MGTVLLASWLVACADGLYFYPDQRNYLVAGSPAHQDFFVQERPGIRLHGWFIPAEPRVHVRGTIIQFHGNAENLTAHVGQVYWLIHEGYNVVVWDYRGYGASTGHPDRTGLFHDAVTMVRRVQARPDVQGHPVYLLGQSLGGALVLAVAGSGQVHGISGVVADSAFASWRGVAREKLRSAGWLGWSLSWLVPLVVSSGYDAQRAVAHIAPVPLLLIQGDQDAVVPPDNLDMLYEHAQPPVFRWQIRGAGHVEALTRYRAQLRQPLLDFFAYCLDGNTRDLAADGLLKP
ncbi:MAG: alpha/beta fold hydrolase [Pseudomonadales bacterium]|nr:alpha/beta fold hydrolase [Pseudomonadales bacterium]